MSRLIILFTLILFTFSISQNHQNDIVTLTLKNQKSVKMDSILYFYFDSTLSRARAVDDTFRNIHAFPDYVFDELILQTKASWKQKWHDGEIETGQKEIDSLSTLYGLKNVEGDRLDIFLLKFNQPLKIDLLEKEYEKIDSILWAEPNGYIGDGDDIKYFEKRDTILYVFEHGWGDCPAGCIHRYYWYVLLSQSNAKLMAEAYKWEPEPRFYPWNYPANYPATHFKNAQSIIDSIKYAKLWWTKRHAIEVSWRFYKYENPWTDVDDLKLWLNLKQTITTQTNQLIAALASAKQHYDKDVAESAEYAYNYILTTGILNEENSILKEFTLYQNYPNPFNPQTTIRYYLPKTANVKLSIYDVNSRLVETLVKQNQTAGEHRVTFNATDLASGIYYYRLQASDFIQTRKMILLK